MRAGDGLAPAVWRDEAPRASNASIRASNTAAVNKRSATEVGNERREEEREFRGERWREENREEVAENEQKTKERARSEQRQGAIKSKKRRSGSGGPTGRGGLRQPWPSRARAT